MLRIDIISVQPQMFGGFLTESIVARAVRKGLCEVHIVDLKEFGLGKWKKTDDAPYGGGPGMLMRCEPWFAAVESVRREVEGGGVEEVERVDGGEGVGRGTGGTRETRVIMTSPAGKVFTQKDAEYFASLTTSTTPSPSTSPSPSPLSTLSSSSTSSPSLHLIFLCGHYEGFDARIETLATDLYSIGDFVMTGGELAAAAMTDAIVRLLPGALGGGAEATSSESFGRGGLLEAPQYTHPPEFRGMKVPEVLLSGDHRKIEAWKSAEARRLTSNRRPDLMM